MGPGGKFLVGLAIIIVGAEFISALIHDPTPQVTASPAPSPGSSAVKHDIVAPPAAAPPPETRDGLHLDTSDSEAIYTAHQLVQAKLRDPDSAIFDDKEHFLQPANVLVHREKGYLAKLLSNARIIRYLAQRHQELLSEFQKIAELESTAA